MSEDTVLFVESLFQGNDMSDKIAYYLDKMVKGVEEIAKKIPEFVKADSQLLEQMTHSVKETDEHLRKIYPQLIRQFHTVQGELGRLVLI